MSTKIGNENNIKNSKLNDNKDSLEIGNKNIITKSIISSGKSEQKESKFLWRILVPLLVAIISGLIIYYITKQN